jgi:hypothetical protein
VAELATIAAGYLGHVLVRLAIDANRHAAERLSTLRSPIAAFPPLATSAYSAGRDPAGGGAHQPITYCDSSRSA